MPDTLAFEAVALGATLGDACLCPEAALPECPELAAVGLPMPARAERCGGVGITADGETRPRPADAGVASSAWRAASPRR